MRMGSPFPVVSLVVHGCTCESAMAGALTAEVVVRVRVDDVNDNRPQLVVNTLAASRADWAAVDEQADAGTFVGHVIVSDADSGRNGKTHCRLEPQHDDFDAAFMLQQMFDNEYQVRCPPCVVSGICRLNQCFFRRLQRFGYLRGVV